MKWKRPSASWVKKIPGLANEKGAAMATVLLIALLFVTLGLILMSMNLASAKQFTKKEQTIQARHLAEMGITDFKTRVEDVVEYHNENSDSYLVYDKGSLNLAASRQKYRNQLCTKLSQIGKTEMENNSETGTYSFKPEQEQQCGENKITLQVISKGETGQTAKEIKATLIVAPPSPETEDTAGGFLPQEPTYPAGNMQQVSTLDDIKELHAARVVHGITTKNPFKTQAYTEILGSVEFPMKSQWTFLDHLRINGSLSMKTAGQNTSILTIGKDLFIGGALHTDNHNVIQADGNFIVQGDVDFGTKAEVNIKGNALFNGREGIKVQPHARITIGQNTYFRNHLEKEKVKNNSSICVKGVAYLWKNKAWSPYLPSDSGYDLLDEHCFGRQDGGGDFNWKPRKKLDVEYY